MRKLWQVFLATVLLVGCIYPPEIPQPGVMQLQGTLYDSILIEVQATTDEGPTQETLNQLKAGLARYRFAPEERIQFIINPPVDPPTRTWLYTSIQDFEIKTRSLYDRNVDDRHLVVYLSYLPGVCIQPDRMDIIGLKYTDTSIAFFTRASADHEVPTLLHEFGHVVGMVNRDHRDEDPVNKDRPTHCNIEECLMYWRVPATGDILPTFDERCLRDLQRLINERSD
jgi:hypothetical protein